MAPKRKAFAVCALLAALSACGPRPPTDSFSANLDANCNPHDPVDKFRALVTAKKFWLEQEYDFKSYLKSGKNNLGISKDFLARSEANRDAYQEKVLDRARELRLSASKAERMIRENMKIYDQQVENFRTNIENQKAELAWSAKCMVRIKDELAALGIADLQLPTEKKDEQSSAVQDDQNR